MIAPSGASKKGQLRIGKPIPLVDVFPLYFLLKIEDFEPCDIHLCEARCLAREISFSIVQRCLGRIAPLLRVALIGALLLAFASVRAREIIGCLYSDLLRRVDPFIFRGQVQNLGVVRTTSKQ